MINPDPARDPAPRSPAPRARLSRLRAADATVGSDHWRPTCAGGGAWPWGDDDGRGVVWRAGVCRLSRYEVDVTYVSRRAVEIFRVLRTPL